MARPPAWRHTLDEARRQALVAIDFYNRPGDRRSFSDFCNSILITTWLFLKPRMIRAKKWRRWKRCFPTREAVRCLSS